MYSHVDSTVNIARHVQKHNISHFIIICCTVQKSYHISDQSSIALRLVTSTLPTTRLETMYQ